MQALAPFGLASEEVLGQPFEEAPWWRQSPAGTGARLRAAIERALERGPCRVLATLLSAAGEVHEIDMAIDPVSAEGEETFLLVIGTDVTAERRQQRRRDQERWRARSVFAASGIVAWRLDVATRRVSAEPELAWLHGLRPDQEASGSLDGYLGRVHRDDVRRVSRSIERSIQSGDPLVSTHRVHGVGGAVQWLIFRGEAERDADDGVSHLTGIVLDITSEHAAVEALEANEARYRRLFESVQEGFCVLEPLRDESGLVVDARYAEVNPAFESQSGLRDVEGLRVREVLPELEPTWMRHVVHVVETGEPVRCTDYSGDLDRWVEISLSRIDGVEGVRVGCLFKDVTKTKRNEVRLGQLADQLTAEDERKSAFLATLAHELRNPLAPVRHGLELMRGAAAEERERLRTMMERQIAHTTRLVDDLLDISRITHDKLVLHESDSTVAELLEGAIDTCRPEIERHHHSLKAVPPDPALHLHVDPARIAQVLSNLLINAARYTPEGGNIGIGAERDELGLRFVVSDDGDGLEEGAQERVFEMFVQEQGPRESASGGLGIGLTLSRRIAEMHGGSLEACSAGLGCGSTFTLSLPLGRLSTLTAAASAPGGAERDAGGTKPPEPSSSRKGRGGRRGASPSGAPARRERRMKVLVVDDNRDAADTLARVLRARGLDAETAYAGGDALKRAGHGDLDALVLDIGMPDISGREVARRYRADGGLATLVALTGWGTSDDVARSFEAGFDHHLTKPATARAVLDVLEGASAETEGEGGG